MNMQKHALQSTIVYPPYREVLPFIEESEPKEVDQKGTQKSSRRFADQFHKKEDFRTLIDNT